MAEFLPEGSLSRIISSTHSSLNLYETLLGLPPEHFPNSALFWDVVVLTTADDRQKHAFEAQIQVKKSRGEIPLVDFQIIADPPGPKIGNGGSTLWVLKRYSALELDAWLGIHVFVKLVYFSKQIKVERKNEKARC